MNQYRWTIISLVLVTGLGLFGRLVSPPTIRMYPSELSGFDQFIFFLWGAANPLSWPTSIIIFCVVLGLSLLIGSYFTKSRGLSAAARTVGLIFYVVALTPFFGLVLAGLMLAIWLVDIIQLTEQPKSRIDSKGGVWRQLTESTRREFRKNIIWVFVLFVIFSALLLFTGLSDPDYKTCFYEVCGQSTTDFAITMAIELFLFSFVLVAGLESLRTQPDDEPSKSNEGLQ